MSVKEFTYSNSGGFSTPGCTVEEIQFDNGGEQYIGILNNFADCILNGTPLLAPGEEGIRGLTVSNAMHLSSWTDSWVDIPLDEEKYYALLKEKIAASRYVKPEAVSTEVADLSGTYGTK